MLLQIPNFDAAAVLVVGDVMLDRYWHGPVARISPEAPVPVVRITETEERPGGAGNVALNLARLGTQTVLLSVTGTDAAADTLTHQLQAAGVQCRFQRLANAGTITKLRVLSRHQQLIRLDFEDAALPHAPGLFADYQAQLAAAAAVVLSDYGKGTLCDVPALIAAAHAQGKPVLVDPKHQDIGRYRGAAVLTPNLHEFEAIVGACRDEQELSAKAAQLIADYALGALLVTRGEHGMSLIRAREAPLHLAAEAREVYDVTGAGDTVIAVLAAHLAAGGTLPDAVRLANLAAGIVVGKLGAATVTAAELRRAVHARAARGHGVVSEAEVLIAAADARVRGETVVVTNGCFDLLHAGHVGYLQQAKALGERLIVAVNSDASVRRLKGAGRPLNPLAARMEVLAALAVVDWVVAFDEDTPERLICGLKPDYLVKGGDYRPEDIAGAECVRRHGGVVHVLPYRDGCSTSALIEAAARQTKGVPA